MSHCDEDDRREQALNIRLIGDAKLTVKDLVVLIQLFYLPNEHGQVRFLTEIWIFKFLHSSRCHFFKIDF